MHSEVKSLFDLSRQSCRPLILDGAMGSLLQQLGIKSDSHLWTSLVSITNPEIVKKIHLEYIEAGSDIITTNTFRSNPLAVSSSSINLSSKDLVRESLRLAKEAAKDKSVLIAGSNAPAEDCYQKERTISRNLLESNHKEHIDLLVEHGSNFILNETQSHMDEIEIICKYCSENNYPFVLSLFFTEEMLLLSGENIFDVISFVLSYNPLAIGFNCILPVTFEKFFLKNDFQLNILQNNWGVYLNCGSGNYTDEFICCGIDEYDYWEYMKNLLKYCPSFIGACCGSNYKHIKEIRKQLDGLS